MQECLCNAIETYFASPEQTEATVSYLSDCMNAFLRRQERVMICIPDREDAPLGRLFARAVERSGGIAVLWSDDLRWKSLLRQAFQNRCTTIIGMPQVILSLTKLSRATGTPLYIRNVVLCGYPAEDWLIEGIRKKLDCRMWGCFVPGLGSLVAGFSRQDNFGIYLRADRFKMSIVDSQDCHVKQGVQGQMVLQPRGAENLRCHTGEFAYWNDPGFADGTAPFIPVPEDNGDLTRLRREFLSWTSVLDFHGTYSEYGLCLELNVFPGESLPKLPSCARLSIHRWNPEDDKPFSLPFWEK